MEHTHLHDSKLKRIEQKELGRRLKLTRTNKKHVVALKSRRLH